MDSSSVAYCSILSYIKNNDCSFSAGYFKTIDIVFTEDIYKEMLKSFPPELQRKIRLLKNEFKHMDATVIMPTMEPVVKIILANGMSHDSVARKAVHEFIHFLHRCETTVLLQLENLYAIEGLDIWEPFYYWDEFTTKHKEMIFHYETFAKWKPEIAAANENFHAYIDKCKCIKYDSELHYMRTWLFLLSEYYAYSTLYQQDFEAANRKVLPVKIQSILPKVKAIYELSSVSSFVKNISEIEAALNEFKGQYKT